MNTNERQGPLPPIELPEFPSVQSVLSKHGRAFHEEAKRRLEALIGQIKGMGSGIVLTRDGDSFELSHEAFYSGVDEPRMIEVLTEAIEKGRWKVEFSADRNTWVLTVPGGPSSEFNEVAVDDREPHELPLTEPRTVTCADCELLFNRVIRVEARPIDLNAPKSEFTRVAPFVSHMCVSCFLTNEVSSANFEDHISTTVERRGR